MSFQTVINTFKTSPTLANAKNVVAHARKYPMVLALMSADDMAAHTQAQRILEDAKNPAKIREAMQTELRARFKGMNIIVS